MTPEVCVGLCSTSQYAGVYDTNCYCADALDAGTLALPDRDSCDAPCPGDSVEFCGGTTAGAAAAKRDAPSNVLLTVYGNMAMAASDESEPQPAPGLGASSPSDYNATVTQTITSTITYTTVCSTDAAKLVTSEYCTTLTVTSCPGDYGSSPRTKAAPKYISDLISETASRYGFGTVTTVDKAVTGYYTGTTQANSAQETEETDAINSASLVTEAEAFNTASSVTEAYATNSSSWVTEADAINTADAVTEVDAQSTVPMTTMTQTCNRCGANGESTVTLTMPLAVVVDMASVGHASATGQTNASAGMGMMPVQAGASRPSGLDAVLMFGIALAGLLLV